MNAGLQQRISMLNPSNMKTNTTTTKGGGRNSARAGTGGDTKAAMLRALTDLNRATEANQARLQNLELSVATLTRICNGLRNDVVGALVVRGPCRMIHHGTTSSHGEIAAAEAIDIKSSSCSGYSSYPSCSSTSSSGSKHDQREPKRRAFVSGSRGVNKGALQASKHPGNKQTVSRATATKPSKASMVQPTAAVRKVPKRSASNSTAAAAGVLHKDYTAGIQQVRQPKETKKPPATLVVRKYNVEPTNKKCAMTKSAAAEATVNKNMGAAATQKFPTKSTVNKKQLTPPTAEHHPIVSAQSAAKNAVRAGKATTKTAVSLHEAAETTISGTDMRMMKKKLSKSPGAKPNAQFLPAVSGRNGAVKKIPGGLFTVTIPPELAAAAPSIRKFWFGAAANTNSSISRAPDARMTNAYNVVKAVKKR